MATTRTIPITRPYLGQEEAAAAAEAVQSGWITQGPRVAEFESQLAEYCGAPEAVAVSSCTAAIHLSLLALGIGPGDEVICPSMSFIATANAIRHAGAAPVFADVDRRTYNLDPAAVERHITAKTKAILVVHQIGLPADLQAFAEIADRRGLSIIEDAACALGSEYQGHKIGAHAELACFSFHPRKVISTGEGGMITTTRPEFAARLRQLRHHGMTISDVERHQSRQVVIESYDELGFNYRMTDIQAAIGIEQMKKLNWIVEQRQRLAHEYDRRLAPHPWLESPYVPQRSTPNYQSYAIQLTEDCPLERDQIMQNLLDHGISTRRGIMLAHREPAHAGIGDEALPNSVLASERSLLIPLFPQMAADEQSYVLDRLFALLN